MKLDRFKVELKDLIDLVDDPTVLENCKRMLISKVEGVYPPPSKGNPIKVEEDYVPANNYSGTFDGEDGYPRTGLGFSVKMRDPNK